jgi:hypothetical protein
LDAAIARPGPKGRNITSDHALPCQAVSEHSLALQALT